MIKLERFLKKHYPDIYKEYTMYLRKDKLPQIGQRVGTKLRTVDDNNNPFYVTDIISKGQKCKNGYLQRENQIIINNRYVVEQEEWWKEIYILS